MPTREEIAEPLQAAKRRAVAEYLNASAIRERGAARGAARGATANPRNNVVGVGVGRKLVKGKPTARQAVRLYVAQKLHADVVRPEQRLPGVIEGVQTDVVELGRLRAQAPVPSSRKRRRPANPGSSIGFQLAGPSADLLMAGTLGAVVARDGQRFILSNNHVLAHENRLAVGAAIFQPGLLDRGDPATDTIAALSVFTPLVASGPNRVDCAIAAIQASSLVATRPLSGVRKLRSATPVAATEGMSVEKVGRGSGHTTGVVFDVSADLTLAYDMGDLLFVDQILIRSPDGHFSDYGDSGALVVDTDSGRAVGLLIGGDGQYSVANHIEDVLTELGLSLVP
jgi:hypothetical protein